MAKIQNPILRGFNPDPSVLRVGEDYYIATSTFEWFPGIQVHHSRDLVNWRLINRPLKRISQLDLRGIPDSCGVWSCCLSFDNGVYHLVYCLVRSYDGIWKDTHNFLITAEHIAGEWSDPVFLSSSGFDGSLFHDEDGRKWYTSMLLDHRKGKQYGGIMIQEFDPAGRNLTGKVSIITRGSEIGMSEGPHLYRKDGYYYLLLAEGGSQFGQAISLARSETITGPYEFHPDNPILSSRDNPDLILQKAGHGDLVRTQDGQWFIAYLVSRPLSRLGRCILGRETAIQKLHWDEGEWPKLSDGGKIPGVFVEAPGFGAKGMPADEPDHLPERDDFDLEEMDIRFQSLRVPVASDWTSLKERPGYLRLKGRESLSSLHYQSLIARRIQHFNIEASTCLEFEPHSFQQTAGLISFYNTSHYHYLHIAGNDDGSKKLLNIISSDHNQLTEPMMIPADLTGISRVFLKALIRDSELQFFYGTDEKIWIKIGPVLDASILSDDYVRGDSPHRPAFTGAFIGISCQDHSGNHIPADFDWFEYKELQ